MAFLKKADKQCTLLLFLLILWHTPLHLIKINHMNTGFPLCNSCCLIHIWSHNTFIKSWQFPSKWLWCPPKEDYDIKGLSDYEAVLIYMKLGFRNYMRSYNKNVDKYTKEALLVHTSWSWISVTFQGDFLRNKIKAQKWPPTLSCLVRKFPNFIQGPS